MKEKGIPAIHVLGLRKEFVDRYNTDELLRANPLTPPADRRAGLKLYVILTKTR